MSRSIDFIRRPLAASILVLALAASAHADSEPANQFGPRGDISGSWYDPENSGHGVLVEMHDGGRATIAWFTFDAQGKPFWLVGLATLDGMVLKAPVVSVEGGAFPPAFDPDQIERTPWGEVKVEFAGCAAAKLSWTPTAPGYSAGEMPLTRVTAVQGTRCNEAELFEEVRAFSFEKGNQDFEVLFADLPPNQNVFYELDYVYEELPAPLYSRAGMRLSGNNHSDDLAMLVKRQLGGLKPGTLYRIELDAEIASNVPGGCFGVGGSPGDSVYMKLGASTEEPRTTTADDGHLRLNIGFGQQSESGEDAVVVGTLANSHSCNDSHEAPWELKTLSTQSEPLRVRADDEGAIWIMAGSDSAFEGRTDWYLTAMRVRLDAVDE